MNDIQKDYQRMMQGVPVETLPRIGHYVKSTAIGAYHGAIGTVKMCGLPIAEFLDDAIGVESKRELPSNFGNIPMNPVGITSAFIGGLTTLAIGTGAAAYAVFKTLEAVAN